MMPTFPNRFFLSLTMSLSLGWLLISTLHVTAAEEISEKPNVVIVITDDQGYGDLSCHGNPILKTPQLDKLHEDSLRLTDYHVAPTCSPTRAAFLTGRWTNRTGVWHTIMGRSMLREDEVTMGQVFKDAGYATGMFGKWHLGDNYPYRPEDRGYTEVLRHGGGGVGQTPDYWDNAYFDGSYWHNGQPTAVKGFCTDVFFDYAKQFIRAQNAANKPFLAYISTNAPHGPMHAPESYSEPYQDLRVPLANFFGMIANIDDNVGELRRFLDQQQLTENTIFIFTTDNGTAAGEGVFNAGMRGKKGSPYDGGHRVPLFLRWPKANMLGGRDVEPLTGHVDILPTLIDLCDIAPPANVVLDGTSIKPLLLGDASDWPDRILITDSQRVKDPIKWRQSAVMTSQWRLNNGTELYDIKRDPGQKENVIEQYPQVKQRLRDFYESWWSELEPTFAKATAIHLGHPDANPVCLTSHDWITTQMTPWNQSQVRSAMTGEQNTGFWNLKIVSDGQYEIRLRRWPEEADIAIDAPLPPGAPVPGSPAYRTTPGKAISVSKATLTIGEIETAKAIEPGAKEVVFELPLEKGTTRMFATFETSEGQTYGAYYAYVRKK